MTLEIGSPAPQFESKDELGNPINLENLRGKKVILYFYPKDDTPGCTTEACNFRDNFNRFSQLGVQVLGVSKDSAQSHKRFKEKWDLNFPLLVDEDEKICQAYDVIKEKNMYGRKYMGIDRSTFLIDEKGNLQKIWRGVKVTGHIDEILTCLQMQP